MRAVNHFFLRVTRGERLIAVFLGRDVLVTAPFDIDVRHMNVVRKYRTDLLVGCVVRRICNGQAAEVSDLERKDAGSHHASLARARARARSSSGIDASGIGSEWSTCWRIHRGRASRLCHLVV